MNDKPATQRNAAVINFPDIKSVETQAAEWMATLDAENPSPEDLRCFKVWVNASPAHAAAFKETIEFWDDLNILTQAVLPKEAVQQKVTDQRAQQPGSLFSRLGIRIAPGGVLASMVMLAGALLVATNLWLSPQAKVYVTQVGEQKTIQLPDNSTVHLNTNSRLEVDFSDQIRGLTLTRGEAHFDVAKNPNRPFEVTAGQGLVRAIGTAFTVHVRKINIEVIVTEGSIEVDRAIDPNRQLAGAHQQAERGQLGSQQNNQAEQPPVPTAVTVTAGNMLTYSQDQIDDIKSLVASQIQKQLAWRDGLLVFKAEPLENVVAEVSRYTALKIVIPERSAREMKVGGLFKVGDTASLFEALEDGFGIHVKEVSDDVVYLISSENR